MRDGLIGTNATVLMISIPAIELTPQAQQWKFLCAGSHQGLAHTNGICLQISGIIPRQSDRDTFFALIVINKEEMMIPYIQIKQLILVPEKSVISN